MKRVLVTNDDGVFSEGIRQLAKSLEGLAEVLVVAPDREQSATGHSLTLHRPLRLRKLEEGWYTVDGTPTDCVNLGVLHLFKDHRPDLIVSGINFGVNLGDDVTYSGTVSATFEGALLGIPSVAFSQTISEPFSFSHGAAFARRMVRQLLSQRLAKDLLLNVNFPSGPLRGVRMTRLGNRSYEETVVRETDPRGREHFWIAGTPVWEDEEGTDHAALVDGCVSITPLHLDLTDYGGIDRFAGLAAVLAETVAESASPAAADETSPPGTED
ncbi:MAG: 5'/3'-nucleotidase SurE [Acidobacteriota bacterium]